MNNTNGSDNSPYNVLRRAMSARNCHPERRPDTTNKSRTNTQTNQNKSNQTNTLTNTLTQKHTILGDKARHRETKISTRERTSVEIAGKDTKKSIGTT